MEEELLSLDYDILRAIAESEEIDSSTRSKGELVRRIIDHREREAELEALMVGPVRVMADLKLRDINYIRERLIEKGLDAMLSRTIDSKNSLIAIYGMLSMLEISSLDELRFIYNQFKESSEFAGWDRSSQFGSLLDGDGSDLTGDVIINRLMILRGNSVIRKESGERRHLEEWRRTQMRDAYAAEAGVLPCDSCDRFFSEEEAMAYALEVDEDEAEDESKGGNVPEPDLDMCPSCLRGEAPPASGRFTGDYPEREVDRQALRNIPSGMRNGAPSRFEVPRVESPGGGAGMAPPDKKQQIKESLLGMGVSEDLAQQAALRSSSVEAALEWILSQ